MTVVQLVDDVLQAGDASLEVGLSHVVVVPLDQSDVHVLSHAEAAVGAIVQEQGLTDQLHIVGVDQVARASAVVQHGVVLAGVVGEGIDIVVPLAALIQSGIIALNADDIALGVVLHLIPGILLHGDQLADAIAHLGQNDLLAVGDDLAAPGPLLGGAVVALTEGAALVSVNHVLGQAHVLANHDGGNDVALLIVQSEHTIGSVGQGAGQVASKSTIVVLLLGLLSGVQIGPGLQVGIVDAGDNALHLVDVAGSAIAQLLHTNSQVHGVVSAVDAGVSGSASAALNKDVAAVHLDDLRIASTIILDLGVELSQLGVVVSAAGHIGIAVDTVRGSARIGNSLHSVHVIGVHSVGAPSVQVGLVNGDRQLALVHVEADGLHTAIQEDGVGLGSGAAQHAAVNVQASQEHVVVGNLDLFHADDIAISIHVDVVGQVLQVGHAIAGGVELHDLIVKLSGAGELVLGAVDLHHGGSTSVVLVVVGLKGVHGNAGHDLAVGHGLDLAVSHSDQDSVLLGHVLDGEVLAGDLHGHHVLSSDSLVLIVDIRGSLGDAVNIEADLVLLAVIVLVGQSQVGVDDSNSDHLGIVVHEHLGQNAVAGAAQTLVVVPVDVLLLEPTARNGGGSILLVHAVDDHGQVIGVHGVAGQQVVQHIAGHLDGVLLEHLRIVHVGADLSGLVLPGVSGTAEHVGGSGQLQVAVVQLLAQLDIVLIVLADVGGAHIDAVVLLVGVGDSGVLGHIADDHVTDLSANGTGEGHHVGLQAVQHQLSDLVTGQSGLSVGVDAIKQLDVGSLTDGGDLPVIAEVVLVLEVTQSLHDHQGSLSSGHVAGTVVQAVASTGGHALSVASSHVGSGPRGHVGEGVGATIVIVVQIQQVGHDDSDLVTGNVSVGIEVTLLVAGHDADSLQDFNGFHIVGSLDVRVARAGADNHHTNGHDGSQSQAQSPFQVSHSEFLLFYFGHPAKAECQSGIFSHI